MKRNRIIAMGLAVVTAFTAFTGCGDKSEPQGDGASSSGKEKITLRIGSGHSESNPWITALEDYFVAKVT